MDARASRQRATQRLLWVAVGLGGCAADAGSPPDTNVDWPAPAPEQWVDPARCLVRCEDVQASRLVSIDANGNLDPHGALRVLDVAQPALLAMLSAASRAGHIATVGSAFRTYDEQLATFLQTTEIGRAARPGHSEHQLGAAVDLEDQGGTAFGWLAAKGPHFGFLLSYPEHLQKTTGLRHEPWHFRYVGSAMARAVLGETKTLEAYLYAHPDGFAWGDCSECPSDLSRSACGSVAAAGECHGSVLAWCFDGSLAEVDCAITGSVCGADASGADCL